METETCGRRMKFGINFFPAFRPNQTTTATYFTQCLRVSERADELGFSSIKTVEHYFHDYGGHSTNPAVLLSAIAARTTRVRLITGAVIPAFNHPIKMAGELAMLDNISNGRLDVGFGRAFIPEEYAAYGLNMEDSRAMFDEGVAATKRLWTEERVTHEGRFWQFKDVHSMPRPFQKPHPPIWVAAIASEESFVNAARNGYHMMIVPYAGGLEHCSEMVRTYRQVWRESGHTPGAEQVQMAFHAYVADTHAEAVSGFIPAMRTYLDVFTEAVSSWEGRKSSEYPGYDRLVEAISSQTPEGNIEKGYAFVGTPDEVIEQVQHMRELFGEHEPSLQVTFGGVTDAEAFRTLGLFARNIMPAFG
ncbi:MAG TPA: LLM class flavin-dependent oxidoreductase [Dehalococcoidia bacterium]|nr:LLM class flavin-dependent oxidoreductase [Dehalococcoidia bacterium]